MAAEFPKMAAEFPVEAPVAVQAQIPATVQAVAAGGGWFGKITSFVWAPFRFLASPIVYLAERFGPRTLTFLKDRILFADNITFRNFGAARKVGEAENVTSTTVFLPNAVLPTRPNAPPVLPNAAPGTTFENYGDAQVIGICKDIKNTTVFGSTN